VSYPRSKSNRGVQLSYYCSSNASCKVTRTCLFQPNIGDIFLVRSKKNVGLIFQLACGKPKVYFEKKGLFVTSFSVTGALCGPWCGFTSLSDQLVLRAK
jgi:hypothetical protein